MHATIQATVQKETAEGTYFTVLAPRQSLTDAVKRFAPDGKMLGELRLDDGRTIRAEQRRRVYATLHDIDEWTGNYLPELTKQQMKKAYVEAIGADYFSLSDCSITTARLFINYLIDFAMEHGVPLRETAVDRTDDINAAIYSSLKHRKCIVCGQDGEAHHWDAIGMGRDRRTTDDSKLRKLCLCRKHHGEAHQIGRIRFEEKYHVYGVVYSD